MSSNPGLYQPIIRGIQAVGSVNITYRYNGNNGKMTVPSAIRINKLAEDGSGAVTDDYVKEIDTSKGVSVAGFRLDGEFLRANPQIASSVVIPILGGGGVALTNNNRTGVLNLNCTKVSTPGNDGVMYNPKGGAIGATDPATGNAMDVYDMVLLAQIQQAQMGGDAAGATIDIAFNFCDQSTVIQFQGVTVAAVDPIALTGNDAASYNVQLNYLNWVVDFNAGTNTIAVNGAAITNDDDND